MLVVRQPQPDRQLQLAQDHIIVRVGHIHLHLVGRTQLLHQVAGQVLLHIHDQVVQVVPDHILQDRRPEAVVQVHTQEAVVPEVADHQVEVAQDLLDRVDS